MPTEEQREEKEINKHCGEKKIKNIQKNKFK